MIFKIPWWAKIYIKLFLSRLPLKYSFWQQLGLFRHGAMDTSEYAISIFNEHLYKTGMTGLLTGKTILELGPGDSISTAVLAATYNAKAVLVDAGQFVKSNLVPYKLLVETLEKKGLATPELSMVKNIDDILYVCDATYLTNGLQSLKQIDANSVDIIFSQAVLEHVRLSEFQDTLYEFFRILKPNGICSHQVDLRDHLGGALNNLRFSNKVWESNFFAKSGFYTNRIRYSQMLKLSKQAGFQVKTNIISRWNSLPTPRYKIEKDFRSLTDDDLLVSVFDIILQK